MNAIVYLLMGCTASGKSALALELASRLGGEILSVDSMKIYRGMDIGTAKPTSAERARIAHHLIDIIEPSESYSLGRFIEDAERVVVEVQSRGQRVVAEGGTMMFVRGLLSGVFEGPGADPEFRKRFRERAEREGLGVLHAELAAVDPDAAGRIHRNDLRRIERAMEVFHLTGRPISALQTQWQGGRGRFDYRVAVLDRPKEELNRRINQRVQSMMQQGFLQEVEALRSTPGGIGPQAAQAVGYAELLRHLDGEIPLGDAVEQIKINTRHLAKSQRTWMRRMPGIVQVPTVGDEPIDALADRVLKAWQLVS